MSITVQWLGRTDYNKAYDLMQSLKVKRLKGRGGDHLLFLEHPPVITMGRRDSGDDLKLSEVELKEKGIDLVKTNRGGKLTFHGPGQLVIYFIFDIERSRYSIDQFVCLALKGVAKYLEKHDIKTETDKKNPGLWIGSKKIASVGFHVERGVTTHGIAFNVCCDLTPFDYFIPCGLPDRGVTSLYVETGKTPGLEEVSRDLRSVYSVIFESEIFPPP